MDETETYRWVAGPTSAAEAARSYRRATLRRRSFQVYLAVVALGFGLYLSTVFEASTSLPARLGWGILLGSAFTAVVAGVVLLVVGGSNRRRISARIRPGDELTSSFGPSSLELGGPLSRHELSYAGLASVQRVDDWVHLRQIGSPIILMWPAALFPEHEVARLKRRVEGQTTS